MRRTLLVAVLVLLGACATEESDPAEEARENSQLACDHFRNVAGDASEGTLTDQELREKLKEVEDNAVIATEEVQEAATAMLRAITQGDAEALSQAVEEMDAACTDAGF